MKKILTIIPIILLLICFCTLFNTNFALAEEESPGYKIDVTLPGGPIAGEEISLGSYIQYLYTFGLLLIGIAALGSLVYGGFLYMLSDTVGSKEDAKKYIWAAISGLILGLSAYLILNTINPDLISLTPPELNDLSEQKDPVPPTDCTEDSSTCGEDQRCVKISEEKSVCKNNYIENCTEEREGESCTAETGGIGKCEGGTCTEEETELKDNGLYCEEKEECKSNICYNDLCVATEPEDPCTPTGPESACVGTVGNCCSKACSKGICVAAEPISYSCSFYCSDPEKRFEETRNTCIDCFADNIKVCETSCNVRCHQEDCTANY